MARPRLILALTLLAAGFCLFTPLAKAGDEDSAQEKAKRERKTPEDTAMPKDMESPEMSVGDGEEASPDYEEGANGAAGPGSGGAGGAGAKGGAAAKKRNRSGYVRGWDKDENVDYSHLLGSVEVADPRHGILPPALGFRGYRPNMVAVGFSDRTPGYGVMIEYSWNRLGAGVLFAYRSSAGEDKYADSQGLMGVYGLYRWLPFDISPYILIGLEGGSKTRDLVGGMMGAGVEARVYQGLTILIGWTFHSTVNRGLMGGAMGWSF